MSHQRLYWMMACTGVAHYKKHYLLPRILTREWNPWQIWHGMCQGKPLVNCQSHFRVHLPFDRDEPFTKGQDPRLFLPWKWNLKWLTASDFANNIPGVMPQPAPGKRESSRESLLLSLPCQLNVIKSAKKLCSSYARGCPSFFPWVFSSLYKPAPCYSLTLWHLEKIYTSILIHSSLQHH